MQKCMQSLARKKKKSAHFGFPSPSNKCVSSPSTNTSFPHFCPQLCIRAAMGRNTRANARKTPDTPYDLRKTHVPRVPEPVPNAPAKQSRKAKSDTKSNETPAAKPSRNSKPVAKKQPAT